MSNNRIHKMISTLRGNKKITMSIGIPLLVLAVILGGLFLSQRLWSNYEASYKRNFDIAKTDINKVIFYNTSQTDTNLTKKLDIIIKTQARLLKGVDSYCEVNSLIKWQSIISQNSSKINDCNDRKERLNAFFKDLSKLTGYLSEEQKLATIILNANVKTNQNNQVDKWEKIEAYWRQAVVDASKLTSIEEFNITKKLADNRFDSVADAWQQLSSANKSKNKQKFQDAEANIEKAYKGLADISEKSQAQVKKLTLNVNRSYKQI